MLCERVEGRGLMPSTAGQDSVLSISERMWGQTRPPLLHKGGQEYMGASESGGFLI